MDIADITSPILRPATLDAASATDILLAEARAALAAPTPVLGAPEAPIDLSVPHRLHVIGVGGPGMSAIAIALAGMGHDVSGSDLREQPVLDRVRAAGVNVIVGHDRAIVHGVDAVTRSTAIPDHNIEVQEALATGVPVLRRAGMLAAISARAQSLAVVGTHGKTTTTSLLMLMLAEAGWRPSFIVGGDVSDVGTGAQWTGHDWLVVEADESDGTHLELPVFGTVLTNVDLDHLDYYGSFGGVVESFDRFLGQVQGPAVVCADDPVAALLAERHGAVTYGTVPGADVRAVGVRSESGMQSFDLVHRGVDVGRVRLPLRGLHNVVNATGAAALAMEIGVPADAVIGAIERFGGVARRFDVRGVDGGATFVDDYGHVPGEIQATIQAARSSGDGWRRVIVVFQPNRYYRIAQMWRDYEHAFIGADMVVLTDIYASGSTPIPGVTGKLIVDAVTEAHPDQRVVWLPRRGDLVDFVASTAGDGDVVISMGCGDIASFPDEVLAARRSSSHRSTS